MEPNVLVVGGQLLSLRVNAIQQVEVEVLVTATIVSQVMHQVILRQQILVVVVEEQVYFIIKLVEQVVQV